MGSGKTSTGQALAEFLGWEFIDLDEEIERQERVPFESYFGRGARLRFARLNTKLAPVSCREGETDRPGFRGRGVYAAR